MRPDEIRVVIRPSSALGDVARPIHASVFKGIFNAFFSAVKAADKEINEKNSRSEFFISHLKMGSNEFGLMEQPRSQAESISPAIDLFKRCSQDVYHSELGSAMRYPKLAKEIVKLGDKIDVNYSVVAHFVDIELPIDNFFCRQTARLKQAMTFSEAPVIGFSGTAITAFDGRLGEIDYRGAVWIGHLMLPGSGAQIECIFDKSKGEDAFNPFGNKRVSITGRAIYTGDSKLPERIEVIAIEEIEPVLVAIDIRGSLSGTSYSGWGGKRENHK